MGELSPPTSRLPPPTSKIMAAKKIKPAKPRLMGRAGLPEPDILGIHEVGGFDPAWLHQLNK